MFTVCRLALAAITIAASVPLSEAYAQAPASARPSGQQQPRLAPGLAGYTDDVLFGDVWVRPDLAPRDRSLVVIATLIATGKTGVLSGHLNRALSNGVTPVEASGVLTHLALYSGWPNAVGALDVYDEVFKARNVDMATLQAKRAPLPVSPDDPARAAAAERSFGAVSPKFTALTNNVVFGDLWRRADLSVRDRSLVTIAALAATGEADQLEPYLKRAVEAGLTRAQIAEAVTHLAFYAGWPRAEAAMAQVARVLG